MKTKNLKGYAMLVLVPTFMLFMLSACKKDSNSTQTQTVTGVQLTTNAKFGSILTDNTGNSLYFFFNDNAATSNCTGGCLAVWKVFYLATPGIGTGLNSSDFATITRTDGTLQTTYKGWPLYYYSGDANAGDTNGDGVAGLWVIGKADYSVLMTNGPLVGLDGATYTDQSVAGTGNFLHLTDANGRTLYRFNNDTHNTNTFTKSDLSNDAIWPMYQVTGVGSIPSMLDKTQFVTVTVFGKTQLVYRGHPMYFFGQDNGVRGSTKGVSFPTPGAAIWKVLNANTPIQ